ncbi:hypothetical protein L6164_011837 [Bauhinia variegata]|uniref:Uncharacterized protein n=1 Tax=Bauhinia variegata TaxID=167791 RepID=A0ACB9P9S0_BAUVA|nr:hypothetical protein L6164_011837 [Bauhinia variegata]
MSSSSEYSEFSSQKPTKLSDKSTFSHTCSLLSQYLKERGSFGDLTLGMTCNIEGSGSPETSCQSTTTMNLFPTKENNVTPLHLTAAMTSLPRQAAYRPHFSAEDIPNLVNSSEIHSLTKEPKTAQLTIFYAGQVFVVDDFPAEKAKEIMSFASKGNTQTQNTSAYTFTQSQPSFPANLARTTVDSIAPNPSTVNISSSIQDRPQTPSGPVVCDLPIARKASLHRFLEKRKDRIAAKAPYQTIPNKSAESKSSWLGLAPQSPQI